MLQLRDFLDRFRPAGAPGAAARAGAGVPADRSAELAAEVGPVLALLDEPAQECARVIEQARQEAAVLLAAAGTESASITADGARRADAVRDAAMEAALTAARTAAAQLVADAESRAARIRLLARERMPGLADRAVAEIRLLTADPGAARAADTGAARGADAETDPSAPGPGNSLEAAGP